MFPIHEMPRIVPSKFDESVCMKNGNIRQKKLFTDSITSMIKTLWKIDHMDGTNGVFVWMELNDDCTKMKRMHIKFQKRAHEQSISRVLHSEPNRTEPN